MEKIEFNKEKSSEIILEMNELLNEWQSYSFKFPTSTQAQGSVIDTLKEIGCAYENIYNVMELILENTVSFMVDTNKEFTEIDNKLANNIRE